MSALRWPKSISTGRFLPVIMEPVLGNSGGEAGQFLWRRWSMLLANDDQFIGNTQQDRTGKSWDQIWLRARARALAYAAWLLPCSGRAFLRREPKSALSPHQHVMEAHEDRM